MAYEALYRRYRPSRFADAFFGQDHVVAALRNAVEGDRVGHAYLFSGPRGTGKTTSARILAKALNCTDLQGGEPCDACDSCQAFNSGSSYDLHELDAASNNGVDAMRDLIAKVALGSPGRTKVYILDEVHMLSSGAENALLKTLEEPPPHVVFVLCTTEPNKVVPTIRSRTQHLRFSLLNQQDVAELIDHVVADAGLEISDEDRAYVVRAGGGSARDTLSALDQVVTAGGAPGGGEHLEALFDALVARDPSAALAAIDGAMNAGRDPANVATSLLAELRSVFLATMRADLGHLPDVEQQRAQTLAASMPPARATRAIEVLGAAVIDMRQAPDPRVDLEVAIMRLTRTDLDIAPEALLERIEALESGRAPARPQSQPEGVSPQAPMPEAGGRPADPAARPQSQPEGVSPQAPVPEAGADRAPLAASVPAAPAQVGPAASPPSAGKRGADMVRAALAEQQAARAGQAAGSDAGGPESGATAEPAPAAAPPQEPPRTLADRRSQAAAAPADSSAEPQTLADRRGQTQPPQVSAQAPPADVGSPGQAPPPVSAQSPPVDTGQVSAQAPPADVGSPGQAPPPVSAQSPPVDAGQVSAQALPGPQTDSAPGGALPPRHEIEAAWTGGLLESLSGKVRSRFSAGHFCDHDGDTAVFGLPNPVHRDRCEEVRAEVDAALAGHFGAPIPLRLVVDATEVEPDIFGSPEISADPDEPAEPVEEEVVDLDGLVDAHDAAPVMSGVERVLATFEGSVVLEDPSADPDQGR